MDINKVEQIKDKICNHMLGVDLSKLPTYELVTYINAYKALEGVSSFPNWAFGSGLGLGVATSNPAPSI